MPKPTHAQGWQVGWYCFGDSIALTTANTHAVAMGSVRIVGSRNHTYLGPRTTNCPFRENHEMSLDPFKHKKK